MMGRPGMWPRHPEFVFGEFFHADDGVVVVFVVDDAGEHFEFVTLGDDGGCLRGGLWWN